MKGTGVIFSSVFYGHDPGRGHPESATRLQRMVGELKKDRLQRIKNWRFVEPEKAAIQQVKLVHGIEYIHYVDTVCQSGGDLLDTIGDTVASPHSFEVALYAVGGTLKAVNLVMEGKLHNSLALVRPPGHHAGKYRACGFCIFNNVAIASQHLVNRFDLNRVLILDIDAHHGNGTQETFYSTDKVLYIGLHQNPREFPGTGFIHQTGEEEGVGYNVNIPLPFRTGDRIYLEAVNDIVRPIIQQYKPQFMLVSAGLDGHYSDPVGSLSLSARCYQQVFNLMVDLASEICQGRLVAVLEGGYSLSFVGKIAASAVAAMSQGSYTIRDKAPKTEKRVEREGEKVISKVKRVQQSFWNTLG